jgi:hypothetical protein
MNKELLIKTLEAIKANPEYWHQEKWHCDTCHCFAGTGELIHRGLPLSTYMNFSDSPYLDFTEEQQNEDYPPAFSNYAVLFDLEIKDALKLFAPENTLEDLERIVNELISR